MWAMAKRAEPRPAPTRWEQDNALRLNPWPFVAIALVVGALVGLAVLLALL